MFCNKHYYKSIIVQHTANTNKNAALFKKHKEDPTFFNKPKYETNAFQLTPKKTQHMPTNTFVKNPTSPRNTNKT